MPDRDSRLATYMAVGGLAVLMAPYLAAVYSYRTARWALGRALGWDDGYTIR